MSNYAVTNPATGEVLATFPTASDADIQNAIAAAEKTYQEWSRKTTVAARAALIQKVADLHNERVDELAAIISREMGKPLDQAVGEVEFSAAIYEYYAQNAEEFLKEEEIVTLGEGHYLVSGRASLSDINEDLPIGLESEEVDTIGGYISLIAGRVPKKDEAFVINNTLFLWLIEWV